MRRYIVRDISKCTNEMAYGEPEQALMHFQIKGLLSHTSGVHVIQYNIGYS